MSDVNEIIEAQINQQGAGVVTVSDGTVVVLTKNILELLLERIAKKGVDRAVLFIKHTVPV